MNQPKVITSICEQVASGETGITGVMFEGNLKAGAQKTKGDGRENLEYGVSITDACVDWETSVEMLDRLNEAALKRREVTKGKKEVVA